MKSSLLYIIIISIFYPASGFAGNEVRRQNKYSPNSLHTESDKHSISHTESAISPPEAFQDTLKSTVKSDSLKCDTIVLMNGEEVYARIVESGIKFVSYNDCGESNAPLKSILKSDIFSIKYKNGTKELTQKTRKVIIEQDISTSKKTDNKNKKINGNALASVILGSLSLLFFPIPFLDIILGVIGLILGLTGMSELKRNPDLYHSKSLPLIGTLLSIGGIIVGLVWSLLIVFLILGF